MRTDPIDTDLLTSREIRAATSFLKRRKVWPAIPGKTLARICKTMGISFKEGLEYIAREKGLIA